MTEQTMSIITDTFNRLQAYRGNKRSRASFSPESSPEVHQKVPTAGHIKSTTQARVWTIGLSIVLSISTLALGIWSQETNLDTEPQISEKAQEEKLLALSDDLTIADSNSSLKKGETITLEKPTPFSREESPPTMESSGTQSLLDTNEKNPVSQPSAVTRVPQSRNTLAKSTVTYSLGQIERSSSFDTKKSRLSLVTSSKQVPPLPPKKKASSNSLGSENRDIRKLPRANTNPSLTSTLRTEKQHIAKAQNLIHNHLYSQAVRVLEPLFRSPPVAWEPWFLMGTAELGLGHLDKAETHFMEGLSRDETIPYLWVQRALVDQQRGQYGKAADALRQAEFFAPNLPKVQLNLAYVLEIQGSTGTAVEHYRRYLSLTDGDPSFFATRRKVVERVAHMENS